MEVVMKTPTYPEISIKVNKVAREISTLLRINRNGKWYRVKLLDRMYFDQELYSYSYGYLVDTQYQRFLIELHKVSCLYEINENAVDDYGILLNPLDIDQRSEEERMSELMPIRKI